MYYPYFIAYMIAGFAISLIVFFWALNKGQFRDQQRARFLPLEEHVNAQPVKLSWKGRVHALVLFTMAGAGLLTTMIAIILLILNMSD